MTAVEWLQNEIEMRYGLTPTSILLFRDAKEMEKKQHYETWFESTAQFSNEAEMLYKKDFEQYYNETFKNK